MRRSRRGIVYKHNSSNVCRQDFLRYGRVKVPKTVGIVEKMKSISFIEDLLYAKHKLKS